MTQSIQILLLENCAADAELICQELRKESLNFSAKCVTEERGFTAALADPNLDIILADHSPPSCDGLAALRSARQQRPGIPFIFVCATLGEETAIDALRRGATDYVLKQRLGRLGPAVRRALEESRERRQRLEAEEALRQSELFRMTILDAMPVGLWFVNVRGELEFSNPFDTALWNGQATVPLDRISNYKNWRRELMRRISVERWAISKCVAEGKPLADEPRRVCCFDGETRTILHSAVPLVEPNGELLGAIGINQDATAHQKAEAQIRQLASLLELTDDIIIGCDLSGRMVSWNKGAERLLGWSAAEVIVRDTTALLVTELAGAGRDCLEQTVQRGAWNGELKPCTKSGRKLILQSRWTLLKDEVGRPGSILIVASDVTERKQIEAQILRAQRLESVGQLAGGIAHDLNNLLVPITMATDLARERTSNPDIHILLGMIESSAKRGAGILRQLLIFSRGGEIKRAPVSLERLVKALERVAAETFPKSITFRSQVAPDLCPVTGDETQLDQVLLNLCVNARDAMPHGGTLTVTAEGITLSEADARITPGAEPGSYVVLRVADTGVGIPPAAMDRIFDPFFTTKEPDKGTGLGLSTVLGIVKGHGGFLRVQSELGSGTQFDVFLPCRMPLSSSTAPQTATVPTRGRKQTILVVDDEKAILHLTRQVLENAGYQVLTAENGAEAVTIYARHEDEIQVVITDMMMPVMDGSAAILVLRRRKPDIKIVATSGVGSAKGREVECLGVNAFLGKPFSAEDLLGALGELLGQRPPSRVSQD